MFDRYAQLLPFTSPTDLAKMGEEFVQYQLLPRESVPACVWEDAQVKEEEEHIHYRMDVFWNYLSEVKGGDGRLQFPILSRIAKLVFTIPQSNADEERVFSIICKNKTCFRPNLSLDKTLPSLLTIKLATNEPCYRYDPPQEVVSRAGKVTWEYNKEHRKST